VYHVLSPDVPIQVTTDVTGALTIVQETQSLNAVCYQVQLQANGTPIPIDPTDKLMTTLSGIQSGTDLGNVQVTNSDGSKQSLLPAGTPTDQRDATAAGIQQFVKISATLPANGARKGTAAAVAAVHSKALQAVAAGPAPQAVWGISFDKGGWKYHEGSAAVTKFKLTPKPAPKRAVGPQLAAAAATAELPSAIDVAFGDFFNWLKNAWDAVTNFFVQVADDVYHFFIQLGNALYHLVLDCISAVVHAVEFIFNKIKVFFEDLIKWLGFLFEWGDILRTHAVIKNIFNCYVQNAISNLSNYKTSLTNLSTTLQAKIDTWAGLPSAIANNGVTSINGRRYSGPEPSGIKLGDSSSELKCRKRKHKLHTKQSRFLWRRRHL
jgi:hypothetical protein